MPEGSARLGHEFRAAVLDEIAGFGDDVLQQVEQLADASFPVNEFRKCFEKRRVLSDGSGGAKRPCHGFVFHCSCHASRRSPSYGEVCTAARTRDSIIESRGSELIYQVWKGDVLVGILVIHSPFHGTARGGIRLAPDISQEEVRVLAERMTLEFGILGLPQWGAKAGIQADADAPEEKRFAALMEFIRA
jgi:hypothetical protein